MAKGKRERPGGEAGASTLAKAVSAILTVEMVVAALAFVATVGVHVAGVETYDILSGSMEPAIKTGSLVYVDTEAAEGSIHRGDVIAFGIGDGKTVTHRVVDVDEDAGTFTTKGDANSETDPWEVPADDVVGKVIGAVPHLGEAARVLSSGKEFFLAALVLFNALLLAALRFLEKEPA